MVNSIAPQERFTAIPKNGVVVYGILRLLHEITLPLPDPPTEISKIL